MANRVKKAYEVSLIKGIYFHKEIYYDYDKDELYGKLSTCFNKHNYHQEKENKIKLISVEPVPNTYIFSVEKQGDIKYYRIKAQTVEDAATTMGWRHRGAVIKFIKEKVD